MADYGWVITAKLPQTLVIQLDEVDAGRPVPEQVGGGPSGKRPPGAGANVRNGWKADISLR